MSPDTTKGLIRIGALAAAIGVLGGLTWLGTQPKPTGSSEITSPVDQYEPGATPVVYREVVKGQPCDAWEASPYAVEAMIDEMVRRGWKPPTQAEAIADTQPQRGQPIRAVEPNAPVPTPAPRTAAPVESAEPTEGASPPVSADDDEPAATPPPA